MVELTPGLMLVHGNRAEQLREVLVAWLRHTPLDPLEGECLLVHSNGIAQWLRLALADGQSGCGIAAALDFLLPARFMWQAYRAVLGAGQVPEQSPLDKDALTWRLVRLLPQLIGQPGYGVLARFLADDDDVRKRHQLARRLADLYDQYQVYRADWLEAWARGETTLPGTAAGSPPLDESQAWQALLWRALLQDLGGEAGRPVGRAAIHEAFMARVLAPGDTPRPAGLPRRILVFGISALPRQTLEALAGLGRWVQILVCVHNPCAHYWADILGDRELLRARYRRQARRPGAPESADADTLHQHSQPLLASWGRQGRDFIGLLDDFDDPNHRARCGQALGALHQRIDVFEELPGATLLEQLQDDIRDLRPLSETRVRWPEVDPLGDASLRFHIAHSPQREVEILHDQLLAAFAADPGLQPRDVIVMVPDIESYAPHIQAVFGLHDERDPRHIPHALADRGQRRADPLAIVLEQLLALPRLRLGIQEVLEWLDVPALRARFGIDIDDLPLLQTWALEANVRWGLHAGHRASFELGQDAGTAHAHTWHFGLQRMLLGYAAGPGAGDWQRIEPYDEPGGLQASVLGGLARLLDALDRHWRALQDRVDPDGWVVRFQALLDDFLAPVSDADAQTLTRFRQILHDWAQLCREAGLREPLPATLVAEHCLGQLDQAGLSQRFFAGAVTFATLMPMRAIPFRRVCLLGMQDGAFPRIRAPEDFDLMATHPRPGDRSRREDDRYLFLEALLSARDQLHVSWVGHSIHDNSAQPPSVLVSQLMEHLDRGWRLAGGPGPLSAALSVHHPLQPFSRRYFPTQAEDGPGALFTYAAEWYTAPAARAVPADAGRLVPPRLDAPLRLELLRQFLRHPVKAFHQQRLQVVFEAPDPELDEGEPYTRDALGQWQLRDELLDAARRAEGPPDVAELLESVDRRLDRLQRRGTLVGGHLGALTARDLRVALQPALSDYVLACAQWPVIDPQAMRLESRVPDESARPHPFEDLLAGWRRNEAGEWGRIHLLASHLVDKNKHYRIAPMIPAWVEHLAAHAHGRPLCSILVSPKGCVRLDPLPEAQARDLWLALWGAWHEGMRAALPVELESAWIWLRRGADTDPASPAYAKARECYEVRAEEDLYLRRSLPGFDRLCADGAFFYWARLLYGALADHIRPYPEGASEENA